MPEFISEIGDPSFPAPVAETDKEQQDADAQQNAQWNRYVESEIIQQGTLVRFQTLDTVGDGSI